MYIKSIRIINFRIFKGEHFFEFEKNQLILLSGPNGHGKSTIFDAIEWCITGKISRYFGSTEKSKFNYVINNAVYESEFGSHTASVEVKFQAAETSEVHVVKRQYKKNSSDTLEIDKVIYKKIMGQKKIEELFLGEETTNLGQNLESILSSSQILSQDTLDDFVRSDKPAERYEILEKILGLKERGSDFQKYIKNIQKIVTDNHSEIIAEKKELEKDTEFEISKRDIIENQFSIPPQNMLNQLNFEKKVNEIFSNSILGEQMVTPRIDNNDIKKQLNDSLLIIDKNIEINNMITVYIENNRLLTSDYEANERYIADKHKEIMKINSSIIEQKNRLESLEKKRESIVSLKKILKKFNRLQEKKAEVTIQINLLQLENNQLSLKLSEIYPRYNNFKTIILNQEKVQTQLDKLKRLLDARKLLNKSISLKNMINEISIELSSLYSEASELSSRKKTLDKETENLRLEKDSLEQTYIEQLITNLQREIISEYNNNNCPICGSEFKDTISLKKQIQELLSTRDRSMSFLNKQVALSRSNFDKVTSKLIEINSVLVEKEKRINDMRSEHKIISNELLKYSEISKDELETADILQLDESIIKLTAYLNESENSYFIASKIVKNEDEICSLNEEINSIKNRMDQYITLNPETEMYIDKAKNIDDLMNLNVEELNTIELTIHDLYNKKDKITEEISLLIGIKQCFEHVFDLYQDIFGKKEHTTDVIKIYNKSKKIHENYISIKEICVNLLENCAYLDNNKQMNQLNKTIVENQTHIEILDKRIKNIWDNISELDKIREVHDISITAMMQKFIIEYEVVTRRIFKQISPHSFYNDIKLDINQKELYLILLDKNGSEINASLTLSSAQTTILALSIFIAFNLSYERKPINFLAIDDPFQNLDDVNNVY